MGNIFQRLEAVEATLAYLCNELGVGDNDITPAPKAKRTRKASNGSDRLNNALTWKEDEEITLTKLRKSGKSYQEIGAILGRTEKACQIRFSLIRRRAN
jgi:DNA-directed RNA polymerase specialized sigma24 family protein